MADYVLLTDSSTDLTKDLRERFGVDDYLPGNITFPDGHTEDSTLDWESISPQDFYTSMSKDSMYTTGFVPRVSGTFGLLLGIQPLSVVPWPITQ